MGARKGCIPWNKGRTGFVFSDEAKAKMSTSATGRKHTKETKEKLSKIAKRNKAGGYIPGSGRGKSGWYKGFWCDSSWELAFVIYNLENNIAFSRNKNKFDYIYQGKNLTYTPDFIVNGKYVEIKGYKSAIWESKLSQFPETINVLYENDMKVYLDYVVDKYGKDYINKYGE